MGHIDFNVNVPKNHKFLYLLQNILFNTQKHKII